MIFLYILGFILIITTVIGIHELGHYLFAKRAKIYCHEFSIGMGPVIFSKDTKDIRYSLKLLPIGGSVEISGEENQFSYLQKGRNAGFIVEGDLIKEIVLTNNYDNDSLFVAKIIDFDLDGANNKQFVKIKKDGETEQVLYFTNDAHIVIDDSRVFKSKCYKKRKIVNYKDKFQSKTIRQRFLTIFGGPLFNFILAFILFFMISLLSGVPTSDSIIDTTEVNTPSYNAGLSKNDKIIEIAYNGDTYKISKWDDISNAMNSYNNEEISLTYIESDTKQEQTTNVVPLVFLPSIGILSGEDTKNDTLISRVDGGRPAYDAGIKAGDRILKIALGNDTPVNVDNWDEIIDIVKLNISDKDNNLKIEEFTFIIERGNEEMEYKFKPIKAIEQTQTYDFLLGISPLREFKPHISFLRGFTGIITVFDIAKQSINLLLFNENVGVTDLSGPVGIYDATRTFLHGGFLSIVFWIAFLSVNIGFMNLLPLPALDGGRLVFIIIEGVTRKKISSKIENIVHFIGFILLLSLIVFITGNDILRLIGIK